MNLLTQLADDSIERKPVEVEIVKGQVLRFRPSEEGEVEEARASAEREAEETYYKRDKNKELVPVPAAVQEWLPAKKETFVRATILSRFFIGEDDYRVARKLFCKIAKARPLTLDHIWTTWGIGASKAEAIAFQEDLEDSKND